MQRSFRYQYDINSVCYRSRMFIHWKDKLTAQHSLMAYWSEVRININLVPFNVCLGEKGFIWFGTNVHHHGNMADSLWLCLSSPGGKASYHYFRLMLVGTGVGIEKDFFPLDSADNYETV